MKNNILNTIIILAAPDSELKKMMEMKRSTPKEKSPIFFSCEFDAIDNVISEEVLDINLFYNIIFEHDYFIEFSAIKKELLSNLSPEIQEFYNKKINKTLFESIEICRTTEEQTNALWQIERKIRITASNSYQIYTYAYNKKPDWSKKLKIIYESNFKGNNATKYGKFAEKCALKEYNKLHLIFRCGLIVPPELPFLGASPDGILYNGEDWKLLEIKCPVKGKDLSANDILAQLNYLYLDEENIYRLKKKHQYYGQIQLGLAVTNFKMCNLMIYCTHNNSYKIIEVEIDEEFLKKFLQTLIQIYFKYALPYFYQKN